MPPAARITDLHVCPAESPEPHVGGPIVTGSADVLINGLPAATVGSLATCDGPPSEVVQGCATIFINGKPAAHLGHLTSHGGFISTGSPNVIFGDQPYVPPPANPLAGMSCMAKMKEALAHAPWDEGLLHALGGAKGVAALVVGIVVLQMVPVAGEVEDALLVIGSVVAGGNVLKGLAQLKQFHDACCNGAKTEADLIAAGKLAADAVATIGVNALLGMLPFVAKGLKGKPEGEALPRPRLPQDVAVDPVPPKALPLSRPIGPNANQNAMMQADIRAAQAGQATDIRVNQQQINAQGERVGVNRPDLQYTDANGQRVYVEYDTNPQNGLAHEDRLLANDPSGNVILKTVK